MSKIEYDLSSIRGIVFDVDGVLSPSTVLVDNYGKPMRMTNIKDGYALQLAVRQGILIAIITGADTQSTALRYNALGIKDIYLKASKKLPVLNSWMQKKGLEPSEVAYVGDDIPDLPCLHAVGLPVAPSDADPAVKAVCRFISRKEGGHGVARDLIEEILKSKGLWLNEDTAFGW